jgi:hypothetical protein
MEWIWEIPAHRDPITKRDVPGDYDDRYSRSVFETVRTGALMVTKASIRRGKQAAHRRKLDSRSIDLCSKWFGILASARKDDKAEIAEYLLTEFMGRMRARFGYDESKTRSIL